MRGRKKTPAPPQERFRPPLCKQKKEERKKTKRGSEEEERKGTRGSEEEESGFPLWLCVTHSFSRDEEKEITNAMPLPRLSLLSLAALCFASGVAAVAKVRRPGSAARLGKTRGDPGSGKPNWNAASHFAATSMRELSLSHKNPDLTPSLSTSTSSTLLFSTSAAKTVSSPRPSSTSRSSPRPRPRPSPPRSRGSWPTRQRGSPTRRRSRPC